jgi:hypothetical protein
MLTIKNPRKGAGEDTGIRIGSFKLVDAGLCNRGETVSILDNPYYSFHWIKYTDKPRRFKCYLEREPIMDTSSIYNSYNFEIYDSVTDVSNGGDSLIYATSVGTHTHLKDRIKFYTWMVNQIVKFM